MSNCNDTERVTTGLNGVGDAVGVETPKWFIAIVNHNTEKATEERLGKMGYETYVAKQDVIRIWKNGRKVKVSHVVIPSIVFIKCTEKERRMIVTLPFIKKFMTNKAARSTNGTIKPLAVIPEKQIDTLRFMLGQSDVPVEFVENPLRPLDKIKIVRGSLKGIEGEVLRIGDTASEILVRLDILGSAVMKIDSVNLQKL